MKKTVFVCDRCGKHADITVELKIPSFFKSSLKFWPFLNNDVDLCENCCSELKEWLKEKSK